MFFCPKCGLSKPNNDKPKKWNLDLDLHFRIDFLFTIIIPSLILLIGSFLYVYLDNMDPYITFEFITDFICFIIGGLIALKNLKQKKYFFSILSFISFSIFVLVLIITNILDIKNELLINNYTKYEKIFIVSKIIATLLLIISYFYFITTLKQKTQLPKIIILFLILSFSFSLTARYMTVLHNNLNPKETISINK